MMIPHQNRHYKGGLLLCGIVNIDPVRHRTSLPLICSPRYATTKERISRSIRIALLKSLWERKLITEEVYLAACKSEVFGRKNFTPVTNSFGTKIGESGIAAEEAIK